MLKVTEGREKMEATWEIGKEAGMRWRDRKGIQEMEATKKDGGLREKRLRGWDRGEVQETLR